MPAGIRTKKAGIGEMISSIQVPIKTNNSSGTAFRSCSKKWMISFILFYLLFGGFKLHNPAGLADTFINTILKKITICGKGFRKAARLCHFMPVTLDSLLRFAKIVVVVRSRVGIGKQGDVLCSPVAPDSIPAIIGYE